MSNKYLLLSLVTEGLDIFVQNVGLSAPYCCLQFLLHITAIWGINGRWMFMITCYFTFKLDPKHLLLSPFFFLPWRIKICDFKF